MLIEAQLIHVTSRLLVNEKGKGGSTYDDCRIVMGLFSVCGKAYLIHP